MIAIFTRLVLPIAAVVLFIYALVDAIKVPDDSMYRAGNKLIWVLVIVLVPVFIGPLVYLMVGRPLSAPTRRRPPPDDLI
jgi:Phospholipase_D-nuclease N-terminal